MSTAELQNKVIKRIVNIQDNYILEDLLTLIDMETINEDVVELSNKEKEQIEIGLIQIANGESFSNEEVEQEIKLWLNNE